MTYIKLGGLMRCCVQTIYDYGGPRNPVLIRTYQHRYLCINYLDRGGLLTHTSG